MRIWPIGGRKKAASRFEREAMPNIEAVYRFALSLVHDPAEADDLVQETFLKALSAFDSFREGTNCKAWLFRIARNSFINRIRRAGREVWLEDTVEQMNTPSLADWSESAFYRGPEAATALSATRMQLERALGEIPRDFRTVILLADVEGFAYKEIAEVMGTPIGTVMSRLYRGRRMMRKKLADQARSGGSNTGHVVPLDVYRTDRETENGL